MAELRGAPEPVHPRFGGSAGARSLRVGALAGPLAVVLPLGRLLAGAIALLTLAHLGALALRHLAGVGSGFLGAASLTSASSFGTWFSSALLGLAAAVALSLGRLVAVDRRRRQGWTAVAALLAALSVDEVAELHERTAEPLRRALDLGGLLYFAWIIPGLAIVALFLVWQWPFLRSLQPPLRRQLAAATGAYLLGAVGLEMLEGVLFDEAGEYTLAFGLVATVEEVLEMAAAAWFLLALAAEMARTATGWSIVPSDR